MEITRDLDEPELIDLKRKRGVFHRVVEHGITTARLAQAVDAEGSVDAVAKLFEIKPGLVRDALSYESQLGLRKAA